MGSSSRQLLVLSHIAHCCVAVRGSAIGKDSRQRRSYALRFSVRHRIASDVMESVFAVENLDVRLIVELVLGLLEGFAEVQLLQVRRYELRLLGSR